MLTSINRNTMAMVLHNLILSPLYLKRKGIQQFDSIAFIIEIQYHSKKRFHHLYNRYTNGLLVYFISDNSVFHFKDVEPTLFLYLNLCL